MKSLLILAVCIVALSGVAVRAAQQTRQPAEQRAAATRLDTKHSSNQENPQAKEKRLEAQLEQAKTHFQKAVARLGGLSAALALNQLNTFFSQQGKALSKLDRGELDREIERTKQALNNSSRRIDQLSNQLAQQSTVAIDIAQQSLSWLIRPMLGLSFSGGAGDSSARGVRVEAVTPGGPADQAGLQAGDRIIAVNGNSLKNGKGGSAKQRLQQLLADVRPDDIVTMTYRHDGRTRTDELQAESFTSLFTRPIAALVSGVQNKSGNVKRWSDLRLMKITPQLGRYFGTDEGVLVVHAPHNNRLKLKDGDVIQRIGGRRPANPVQAKHILRSYKPGDKLRLSIKRDKQQRTLNIEVHRP